MKEYLVNKFKYAEELLSKASYDNDSSYYEYYNYLFTLEELLKFVEEFLLIDYHDIIKFYLWKSKLYEVELGDNVSFYELLF